MIAMHTCLASYEVWFNVSVRVCPHTSSGQEGLASQTSSYCYEYPLSQLLQDQVC